MTLTNVTPCSPVVDINPDVAAAQAFSTAVRTACRELTDDPFSLHARAQLLALIVVDSSAADEAWLRIMAEHDAVI